MDGDTPPGLLPPFRVANDYMGALRVSDCSPVGGSRFPFYSKVASDHFRFVHSFRNKRRFSNFSSEQFSRGHSENHRDPEGSKGDPTYSRRNTGFDFQERDRSDKRFSEFVFVPDLCDPQEIGGSACHPESKRVQSVHYNPTLQDGDSERYSSTAISKRLGCVDRFERCLPPHSGSSAIQEVLGFPIHRHDLSVQSSAFRPQRLALGLYKSSSYSCGPSPPSRNSSLLLSGRLAPSGGVQGALGASSSDDPAMDPGSGFPCELEEVFPGTAETSCLSRGTAGHPEFVGSSLGAQSTGSSVCDSGSHQRLVGFRPLVAEISRPSRQLCGSSPQLQDADETSSASLPTVLHSLDRSSGQTCSFESRGQGFVQGVGLPLSSSRRETICPSTASSGDLHRRFGSRLWGGSSSTPSVRGVIGFGPHKFSRVEGGPSCFTEPRVSCRGSVGLDSFRQDDRGIFHQLSGRNSFLVPVSAGLGPVGMVPSEENLPSGSSHSGRRQHCGGFSLKGKISPIRMGLEALGVSQDLPCVVSSSGDRLVRFGAQFSAPEVLLSVPGRSCLEDRRAVVSVDESSSVRVSSFLSSPQDLGQDCSGRSGPSPGCPVLASETLVSSSPSSLGRSSKGVASSKGPSGTTPVSDSSSQSRKSSSFSMASLRQQGEEAGLSQRAAQFSAEALRQSTRDTYDSRLEGFREWCAKIPCDPTSASLGVVADFLISLFDKGLALATLRSYRSAIASCHRGFHDGSSLTNSPFLTRLLKSFFLKRPPFKTLLPAWSLPAVLKVLASAPFEPLHKASLRLLTLKTAF